MAAVSRAVRRSAFAAVAAMPGEARVSVNVAPSDLADAGFLGEVERDAAEAGIGPGRIVLEFTEEILLSRVDGGVRRGLDLLRGRGARVALDDFGTGRSGLSHLLGLPLDVVKLDRSFVAGIGRDPRAEAIVQATVGLARSLGIEVVAEGIETEAQSEGARDFGCDLGQGYLIAAPMAPADAAAWLAARGAPAA